MGRFGISKRSVSGGAPKISNSAEFDGYTLVPRESWDETPLKSYYKFIKEDGKKMSGFLIDKNPTLFTFRADLYDSSSFMTKIGRNKVKELYLKDGSSNKDNETPLILDKPQKQLDMPDADAGIPAFTSGTNNNLFCGLDAQTSKEIQSILQDKSAPPVSRAEHDELKMDVKKIASSLQLVIDAVNNR